MTQYKSEKYYVKIVFLFDKIGVDHMKSAIKYDNYTLTYNPDEVVIGTVKAGFSFFIGVTIHTFYALCYRFNISILSSEKLGGFIVKDYRIKIKGKRKDIRKLMCYLDDF